MTVSMTIHTFGPSGSTCPEDATPARAPSSESNTRVWVDVLDPTPEELDHLLASFSLHPLAIEDATKQMGDIVCALIRESFADINYDRAAAHLGVMREELISLEEPDLYNSFLRDLKKKIHHKELDGDRMDMWRGKIIAGGLGLIIDQESEVSSVTEAEAKKVRYPVMMSHECLLTSISLLSWAIPS